MPCQTSLEKSYLIDHDVAAKQSNYASIKVPPQSPSPSVVSAAKSAKFNMNYDDILEELGELGPWQLLHLALLWLPAGAGGIFVLTYSFSGKLILNYLALK